MAATRLSPCRTPLACRPCRPQRTATRRHVVVPVIIRVHLTCRGLRGPTGAGKGEQRGPPPLPPCGACSPITAEQREKERREKRGSVIAQPRFRRRVAVGRRPCLPPYGRRWSPASARCVGGSPREAGGQSSARRRPPAARPTRTGVGAGEGRTELCAQLCATCLPNPTTISGSAEKEIYNEQRKGEARRGAGAGRRRGRREDGNMSPAGSQPRAPGLATGGHGQPRTDTGLWPPPCLRPGRAADGGGGQSAWGVNGRELGSLQPPSTRGGQSSTPRAKCRGERVGWRRPRT